MLGRFLVEGCFWKLEVFVGFGDKKEGVIVSCKCKVWMYEGYFKKVEKDGYFVYVYMGFYQGLRDGKQN